MDPLETYLQDHYAGSTGGVELIGRLLEGSESDAETAELSALRDEIAADQKALEEIMASVGVEPSTLKNAGARVGEHLSRPKLHGKAPDARVLQIEGMIMGVTGKLQLWRSLIGLADAGDGRLDRGRLERLHQGAEEQRARLERIHGETGGLAASG